MNNTMQTRSKTTRLQREISTSEPSFGLALIYRDMEKDPRPVLDLAEADRAKALEKLCIANCYVKQWQIPTNRKQAAKGCLWGDEATEDAALLDYMKRRPSFGLAMTLRGIVEQMRVDKCSSTDMGALEKRIQAYSRASEAAARFSEYDREECRREGLIWDQTALGEHEYPRLGMPEDIARNVAAYRKFNESQRGVPPSDANTFDAYAHLRPEQRGLRPWSQPEEPVGASSFILDDLAGPRVATWGAHEGRTNIPRREDVVWQ